jgi:hypothetical protein
VGVEGYFSLQYLANKLQQRGIDREDTFAGANYLLNRYLINADHMNHVAASAEDSVKIAASGYII